MIESIINCKNLENSDAIILSAGYGKSFTYRGGAENGPTEVIKCLNSSLEFFDRFLLIEPNRHIKIAHHDENKINNLNLEKALDKIKKFNDKYKNKFILMLGGSHSVTIGTMLSLKEQRNPKELTVSQIDAHPDLRDNTLDYKPTTHKYDHACVMRRVLDFGFKTVQVGNRAISVFDHEVIKKRKLKVFEWGRRKNYSVDEIIKSISTKDVYLTLDMDGLDPSLAPGTGTPVPGGIDWKFVQELVRKLAEKKNVIGADVVEISPINDQVLTQYVAANLCYNIISYNILKKKNKLKFYN